MEVGELPNFVCALAMTFGSIYGMREKLKMNRCVICERCVLMQNWQRSVENVKYEVEAALLLNDLRTCIRV